MDVICSFITCSRRLYDRAPVRWFCQHLHGKKTTWSIYCMDTLMHASNFNGPDLIRDYTVAFSIDCPPSALARTILTILVLHASQNLSRNSIMVLSLSSLLSTPIAIMYTIMYIHPPRDCFGPQSGTCFGCSCNQMACISPRPLVYLTGGTWTYCVSRATGH